MDSNLGYRVELVQLDGFIYDERFGISCRTDALHGELPIVIKPNLMVGNFSLTDLIRLQSVFAVVHVYVLEDSVVAIVKKLLAYGEAKAKELFQKYNSPEP